MNEAHIENGVFSNQERCLGFGSTCHEGFLYFCAVRDSSSQNTETENNYPLNL